MNWQQIKTDCPKAWEAWMSWIDATYAPLEGESVECTADRKDLWYVSGDYDSYFDRELEPESLKGWIERFFDEQGILIFISPHGQNGYMYTIHFGEMKHAYHGHLFSTRLEAFTAAATEAFRVLEGRLND